MKEILGMLEQQKVYFSLFTRAFSGVTFKKTMSFSCKPMQHFHGQMNVLKNEMERWVAGKFSLFILAE
jgi:transcription-repair coupling factor (superfamily II helicase)